MGEKSRIMKQRTRYSVSVFSALILLWVVCFTNVLAAEQVTITGTVLAMDWDDEGKPIAGFIHSMGEGYQIVDDAMGRQLFKLDHRAVIVSGVVGEDSEGYKTISVISYEIIAE